MITEYTIRKTTLNDKRVKVEITNGLGYGVFIVCNSGDIAQKLFTMLSEQETILDLPEHTY